MRFPARKARRGQTTPQGEMPPTNTARTKPTDTTRRRGPGGARLERREGICPTSHNPPLALHMAPHFRRHYLFCVFHAIAERGFFFSIPLVFLPKQACLSQRKSQWERTRAQCVLSEQHKTTFITATPFTGATTHCRSCAQTKNTARALACGQVGLVARDRPLVASVRTDWFRPDRLVCVSRPPPTSPPVWVTVDGCG